MRVARPRYFASRTRSLPTPGDRHRRNAVTIAGIDYFHQVADGLMLMHAADIHLDRQGGCVEADGIVNIYGDQFVGQLLQDALASAGPEHDGPGAMSAGMVLRRAPRVTMSASA